MELVCYECIVKPMCKTPCDILINFLKENLDISNTGINGNSFGLIAKAYREGKFLIYDNGRALRLVW